MFNVCTFTTSLLSLLYSSWLPTYIYVYIYICMYLYELLYLLYVCYICVYVGIRALLRICIDRYYWWKGPTITVATLRRKGGSFCLECLSTFV